MDDAHVTAFRRVEKHFKSRHAQGPEAVKQKKRQSKLLAALGLAGQPARNEDYPVLNGRGVMNLSRTGDKDEVEAAGWDIEEDPFGGREYEEIEVDKTDDFDSDVTSRPVKGYIIGDGERFSSTIPACADPSQGLIYIPQYLSPAAQLRLTRASLEDYTRPPNPLNLSTHYVLPPEISLFDKYVQEPTHLVDSKAALSATAPVSRGSSSSTNSTSGSSIRSRASTPQRELVSNKPAHEEGYEALKQKVTRWQGDEPSFKLKSKTVAKLMETELRWANLGWVYNVSRSTSGRV